MRWHSKNDGVWLGFEEMLKSHIPSVLAKDNIRHQFIQTAFQGLQPGPIKPMAGAGACIWSIRTWGAGPEIWVDRLAKAFAIFSKETKAIVVSKRVVRSFEMSPSKQEYRDAVEMLMMHELLHWTVDQLGGTSEHSARGGNDIVYGFEKAVYSDAEARDRTLEQMNQ